MCTHRTPELPSWAIEAAELAQSLAEDAAHAYARYPDPAITPAAKREDWARLALRANQLRNLASLMHDWLTPKNHVRP